MIYQRPQLRLSSEMVAGNYQPFGYLCGTAGVTTFALLMATWDTIGTMAFRAEYVKIGKNHGKLVIIKGY